MAKHVLLLLLTIATVATTMAEHIDTIPQSENPAPGQLLPQKLTHLRFYWHDVVSGRNPTSIPVASSGSTTTNTSSTPGFGQVNMIDDPLTAGTKLTSKLVGRAQGLYALASKEGIELMMAMNFAFVEGKYNGSTLTVLGRNAATTAVREMPVVGGSGLFRFARGYVQARTQWIDLKTGDATVEYNVFVMH